MAYQVYYPSPNTKTNFMYVNIQTGKKITGGQYKALSIEHKRRYKKEDFTEETETEDGLPGDDPGPIGEMGVPGIGQDDNSTVSEIGPDTVGGDGTEFGGFGGGDGGGGGAEGSF